jgi:hypothetical protein
MLKHLTTLCLFIALAFQSKAQLNLVPNGSFEEYVDCPDSQSQIERATGWINPGSYLGDNSSPDYFNSCYSEPLLSHGVPENIRGEQMAKTGNAYAGIFVYPLEENIPIEYITIKLNAPLLKNNTYCLSFYVSLADGSKRALNNLGAVLNIEEPAYGFPERINKENSSTYIQSDTFLTDTASWTLISGQFIATGNENYLTIGNINLTQNDDSSIVNSHYVNIPQSIAISILGAYYYIDDVALICCDISGCIQEHESPISIYPNPAAENVTITLPSNTNKAELLIYTAQGQLLSQTQISSTQTINTSNLANGLYLFVIQSNGNIIGREKVTIVH